MKCSNPANKIQTDASFDKRVVLSPPQTQSVWSTATNRSMLVGDGRSLQIDLVSGFWAIPIPDIPGGRESGAAAPLERAPPQVSRACCFLECRQDGVRWSLRAGA